jgi:hypothetical protein
LYRSLERQLLGDADRLAVRNDRYLLDRIGRGRQPGHDSGIGLFYYLRVIVAIYMQPATETSEATSACGNTRVPIGVLLAALTAALVWRGLYPGPLIEVIQAALAIA